MLSECKASPRFWRPFALLRATAKTDVMTHYACPGTFVMRMPAPLLL